MTIMNSATAIDRRDHSTRHRQPMRAASAERDVHHTHTFGQNRVSRRIVAYARLCAAVVVASMPEPLKPQPRPGLDGALHVAWSKWLAARKDLAALPEDASLKTEETVWLRIERAEAAILSRRPKTPAGAAVVLKITLAPMISTLEADAAFLRGDFDWLASADLDWAPAQMVNVIRALEAMEG